MKKGRFEDYIVAMEKFGARSANVVHKTVVTGLMLGTAYGFYTLLRDYR